MLTFGDDTDSNEVRLMEKKRTGAKLPTFSVLMTVYDKEQPAFLDRSLQSVEEQTVSPDQIVVVTDGPLTPELDRVLDRHQDMVGDKFRVVRLPKNIGRGRASQAGIDVITTEWIARMDSDDVCLSDRFEKQIEAIIAHPQVAVVGGYVLEFAEDEDNIVGKRKVPLTNDDIRDYAKYRNPINNPAVMFKRELLPAIGGYPAMNILEDYDLWVRFIANGYELMNLPEYLVKMRVGSGMYSRRGGMDFLKTYIKMKRKWRQMGVGDRKSELTSNVMMTVNTLLPDQVRKFVYQKILHKNCGQT